MRIINTTDGKYAGRIIDITQNPINLDNDSIFYTEKTQNIGNGQVRLSNSNYIIDTEEE